MNTQVVNPAELAGAMVQACERFVENVEGRPKSDSSEPYIRPNVWASQFSSCAREMTLRMTKSHELPPFKPEQLARFRRGKDRARNVKSDLEQAGRDAKPTFELVGAEERFSLKENGIPVITGKVDWKTKFAIPGLAPIPTEYKSWSPFLTDRVEQFEDLFENRWTRKGAFQLLSYMWAMSSEHGLFVLDRPGIPKVLPVSLYANEDANLKRVEKFLLLAAIAVKHKNAGTLPPYIADVEVCKACDFLGSHCTPPMLEGKGAKFFTDPFRIQRLQEYWEIVEAGKRYNKLWNEIKEDFRGVEHGLCGETLIQGKYGKNTTVTIPPEHQALYDSWKKVDPKGKFTITLSRLGTGKEAEGND
jgi:hypothetical protein